jgi:hypothetical protein
VLALPRDLCGTRRSAATSALHQVHVNDIDAVEKVVDVVPVPALGLLEGRHVIRQGDEAWLERLPPFCGNLRIDARHRSSKGLRCASQVITATVLQPKMDTRQTASTTFILKVNKNISPESVQNTN